MLSIFDRAILGLVRLWVYCRHPWLVAQFYWHVGYWPDPGLPSRYNEKLLWRKVFDRNPLFTLLSDRLQAQDFLCGQCPELKVAERLWTGTDPSQIPQAALAPPVVVKATHGSNWLLFVEQGRYSRDEILAAARKWMKKRYGGRTGEWGYAGVAPAISVERMLIPRDGQPLLEMKFHACDGEVVICFAITHPKRQGSRCALFAADGTRLSARAAVVYSQEEHVLPSEFRLPENFSLASRYIAQASRGLDYARYDIMSINGQLYAGEVTLYCNAGYAIYDTPDIEQRLAAAWDLRKSWFLSTPQSGFRKLYAGAIRARLTSGFSK